MNKCIYLFLRTQTLNIYCFAQGVKSSNYSISLQNYSSPTVPTQDREIMKVLNLKKIKTDFVPGMINV